MNKLSSLLQKVDAFEKLAVFGDRKLFLQSLADGSMLEVNPELEKDPEFQSFLRNNVPYADLMDKDTIRTMWIKFQNDKAKNTNTKKPQSSTDKQAIALLNALIRYTRDPKYYEDTRLQAATKAAWDKLAQLGASYPAPSKEVSEMLKLQKLNMGLLAQIQNGDFGQETEDLQVQLERNSQRINELLKQVR